MSAQPVDVLAVMDREVERAGGVYYADGRDLIAARAAVAELVRRADDVLNLLENNEAVRKALAPLMPDTARGPDHPRITKLRAALVRMEPQS